MATQSSLNSRTGCTTITPLPQVTYTFLEPAISSYCPTCDSAKATDLPYTTTYEATYINVGPTGLVQDVYTVTNTGIGTTPINTNTIPPGFTTTAVVCTACAGSPTILVTTKISPVLAEPTVTDQPSTPVTSSPDDAPQEGSSKVTRTVTRTTLQTTYANVPPSVASDSPDASNPDSAAEDSSSDVTSLMTVTKQTATQSSTPSSTSSQVQVDSPSSSPSTIVTSSASTVSIKKLSLYTAAFAPLVLTSIINFAS